MPPVQLFLPLSQVKTVVRVERHTMSGERMLLIKRIPLLICLDKNDRILSGGGTQAYPRDVVRQTCT